MKNDKAQLVNIPLVVREDSDDVDLQTNGIAQYIGSPISDAISKLPPKKAQVPTQRLTYTKKGEFEDIVCSIDVRLVKRGQISLFREDNEIQLSDNSHKIFVGLLVQLRKYYEFYGRDVENLRVALSLKQVALLLGKPELTKNNKKEVRLARAKFFEEISTIRAVGSYTYYEKGKQIVENFDTSVFDPSWTQTVVDGKVVAEGYRISTDFYYSLIRCQYYKQIPFTAFASSGKYGFSIILNLYTHSRENRGRQELKTATLLLWLGLDTNPSAPSFGTQIKRPIIEQLRNSYGIALKSFKFLSSTDGQELDPDTCKNREWVESTLVWEQLIPSETDRLLESKERQKLLPSSTTKRKPSRKKKAPQGDS